MAKRLFAIMFGCCLTVSVLGCGGGDDYAVPDVDSEESKVHEDEVDKAMEAEMEKQMSGAAGGS